MPGTDRKLGATLLRSVHNVRGVTGGRTVTDHPVRHISPSKKQWADFRFIDLFAGIGGLRRPFEEIGGRCVFSSEWDRFCRITYTENFPEPQGGDHQLVGDIRRYARTPATVPAHDVLLAGLPCQAFSIAGVSKKNSIGRPHGFQCSSQGRLFFDVVKILDWHRPSAFLIENVKFLCKHDGGKTLEKIKRILENKLSYHVSTRIVNSSPWVPQKRERLFIVGFRERADFSFSELPIPAGPGPVLGDILDTDVDPKYTLTTNLWNYLQAYKEKHRDAGNGFGFSLFGPNDVARTLSARYHKDGSEILIRQGGRRRPRRLTPRECARLMGFDAPGEGRFRIPVSDTQAYRQFGNSVVVPAVRAVAKHMRPHIEQLLTRDIRHSLRIQHDERYFCEVGAAARPMMTDIVTPDIRRRMMSGIGARDTRPELTIRSALHRLGFRFRLHRADLPGKPDLVFPKYRAIIFVHGCFWHRHDCHLFRWPKTRRQFWRRKIESNSRRDRRHLLTLTGSGWRVALIWECALRGRARLPIKTVAGRCTEWLVSGGDHLEIRGDETQTTA